MEKTYLYDTIFGIFVFVVILLIVFLILYKINEHEQPK